MWGLVDFPNLCISQTANWALVDGKTVGGEEGAQSGATVPGPGGRTVCVEPSRHLQPAGGVEQKQ